MAEFLYSPLVQAVAGNYFAWFFQKIHRSPQHLETIGLAMRFKVLLRVPFLEQAEDIFILHGVEKIAANAALFGPDGVEQGGDRLGQFLPFRGRHLHVHDDQNHNGGYEQAACRIAETAGDIRQSHSTQGMCGRGGKRKAGLQEL